MPRMKIRRELVRALASYSLKAFVEENIGTGLLRGCIAAMASMGGMVILANGVERAGSNIGEKIGGGIKHAGISHAESVKAAGISYAESVQASSKAMCDCLNSSTKWMVGALVLLALATTKQSKK